MEVNVIPISSGSGVGKFIVYRPRVGLAFVSNRAMATLALALADEDAPAAPVAREEVLDFLDTVDFFQPDPPPPPPEDTTFCPTTAVLLMTNQCQLRCTYCYAAAGDFPKEELSPDLGCAAIDYVCRNALEMGAPQFEVSFHGGGEPTFAWETLKACAAYARQKPLRAYLSLTSNGIWSPAQCEWIIANLDNISLSLDGSHETQDRQRPLVSGSGSSNLVMRTVAELDQRHFNYGIRMTATAPWQQLPEDVRFLCEETGCTTMQVEPAFNTVRGKHTRPQREDALGFVEACLEAIEIAERAGRHLYYSGARLGVVTTTFCTAPYNALIVNGSGDLVACYEIASPTHPLARISTLGKIENGTVIVDTSARHHLHQLMAERREDCRDCFCYWSCAGDCYTRTFRRGAKGHLQRGARCEMNRALTEKLLLQRIADGSGIWRAQYEGLRSMGTTVESPHD